MPNVVMGFCNPYGTEGDGTVRLLGGMYPENHMGHIVWDCRERPVGRFKFVCTGGSYGFRAANDSGIVPAFECPGGHPGEPMKLCAVHVRDFNTGPPYAGYRNGQPVGQIGGSVVNSMCPACMWPPEARRLHGELEGLAAVIPYTFDLSLRARLMGQMDVKRARMDELHQSGRVHKCPLKLTEVS